MLNLPTQSTRVSASLTPISGGVTPFKSAGSQTRVSRPIPEETRPATRYIKIAPQPRYLTAATPLKSRHLHEEARIVGRLEERGGASFEKVAQDAPPDSERSPQPTEIEELNSYKDFALTFRRLLTKEVGLVSSELRRCRHSPVPRASDRFHSPTL